MPAISAAVRTQPGQGAHELWSAWDAAGGLGCSGRHACNKAYVEQKLGNKFSAIDANFKLQVLIHLQRQLLSFVRPQVRGKGLAYLHLSDGYQLCFSSPDFGYDLAC